MSSTCATAELNFPAMLGFKRRRFQNEDVQRALWQVNALIHRFPLTSTERDNIKFCCRSAREAGI
jgi:hypothetical protein